MLFLIVSRYGILISSYVASTLNLFFNFDNKTSKWISPIDVYKRQALSTHNGQNFAAAVEIDVAKNDVMATEDEITQVKNTIIEDAKTINLDDYSKVCLLYTSRCV